MAEKAEKTGLNAMFFHAIHFLSLALLATWLLAIVTSGVIKSFITGESLFTTIRLDVFILVGGVMYIALLIICHYAQKAFEKAHPVEVEVVKVEDIKLFTPEAELSEKFQDLALQCSALDPFGPRLLKISEALRQIAVCQSERNLTKMRGELYNQILEAELNSREIQDKKIVKSLIELCWTLYRLPENAFPLMSYRHHWQGILVLIFRLSKKFSDDQTNFTCLLETIKHAKPEYDLYWILYTAQREKILCSLMDQSDELECRKVQLFWRAMVETKSHAKDKIAALENLIDVRKQLLRWRLAKDIRSFSPLNNLSLMRFLWPEEPINSEEAYILASHYQAIALRKMTGPEKSILLSRISNQAETKTHPPRNRIIPHPQESSYEDNKGKGKGRKRGKKN